MFIGLVQGKKLHIASMLHITGKHFKTSFSNMQYTSQYIHNMKKELRNLYI